ncbi:Peroxisomal membrane protein PEX28 [Spathaspora sp. JA1]|nr:Peroxisomal membrane protein PEX28 [Spathaspora sp. JA1]
MDRPSYKERALGILYQAIEKSNTLAQSHPGTKRGIAAGTASVLLEMGMEASNKPKPKPEVVSNGLVDDQISSIESVGTTEEEEKSRHFSDRLIEKLIQTSIPESVPERNSLENRLKEGDGKKVRKGDSGGISIVILTRNLRKLLFKLTLFFHIYYGGIHILTWKRPAKTITMLILYTWLCNWPHLVLCYPLVYVLFGVFIPGYIQRHPMRRREELIKVKTRGQSLWNYFFDSEDSSILQDIIKDEEYFEPREEEVKEQESLISEIESGVEVVVPDEELVDKRKSQLDLMLNLKDLQGLTSDLLVGIEQAEQAYEDIGGFKDERLSTFLVYVTLIGISVVLFAGQFIPWRIIFIASGWIGMILLHPKSKKLLLKAKPNAKPEVDVDVEIEPEVDPEIEPEITTEEHKLFDRSDIIVDDSPEVRNVEIFELQIKSILNHQWTFYRYSNTIFDNNNKLRISGKRPVGVDDLSKVLPPPDWKFDFGLINKWKIDENPQEFLYLRSYDMKLFKLKDNDGWIYDSVVGAQSDLSYEFRRRRLTRECFRYG